MRENGRLTVGRQVALAFSCQEVIALPLALELGCKLFCRDLGVGHVTCRDLLHVLVVLIHIEFLKTIKRFIKAPKDPS